jgi:hypothetical protein
MPAFHRDRHRNLEPGRGFSVGFGQRWEQAMTYLGIPAAALAGWMFGAFWYTAFSRQWLAAVEMGKDEIGKWQRFLNPMIGSVLAELVLAAGLSYVLDRMSVVGWHWGAMCGLIIGLFVVGPTVVVNYIFPGRKPMLMLLDAGHWICVLTIMGAILGFVSGLGL